MKSKKKKKTSDKNPAVSEKASFVLACITVYIITFAAITGIICFIVPQLSNSIELFSTNFNTYADNMINFVESNKFRLDYLMNKIDLNDVMDKINDIVSKIPDYIPTVLSKTVNITSSIIGGMIDIFIGLVFSIYILMDKRNLKKQSRVLAKSFMKENYPKFAEITKLSYNTFSNFLSGQLIEAVVLGILCFVGMSIFRFDYAPLISVIIGITNMIPIVGPILGTIPGALILLMVNPIKAVWFVVFIVIVQQIDSNLIYPKIVGNSIGLPGLWVLFAITVGGGLGGVLGMILGVPIASILYAFMMQKVNEEEPETENKY